VKGSRGRRLSNSSAGSITK